MTYDVIIILAGGIHDDGSLPTNSKKRVEKGKELFDQKLAPRIIMSGRWSSERDRDHDFPPRTEAEAMKQYAQELGVPPDCILKEERSNTTRTNIKFTVEQFLEPQNWKKIIVVTSDYHFSRAKHMFSSALGPEYQVAFYQAQANLPLHQRSVQYVKEKLFQLYSIKHSIQRYLQQFIGKN